MGILRDIYSEAVLLKQALKGTSIPWMAASLMCTAINIVIILKVRPSTHHQEFYWFVLFLFAALGACVFSAVALRKSSRRADSNSILGTLFIGFVLLFDLVILLVLQPYLWMVVIMLWHSSR